MRLGHRHEALESHHRYEALMINEIDLPPSELMKALAQQVAALAPAA